MMNVTGAVVAMEESTLSLDREEILLDKLMESVRPEMMETTSNGYGMKEVVEDVEDWLEDSIFNEIDFDDWVEVEMEALSVTMEVGPEEFLVSRQENMALGLAIFNPESYATPKKTLKHELWGKTLSSNALIENFGPTMCSTPRQALTNGLATERAGTQPTFSSLPSQEQVASPGLAMPLRTPTISPLVQIQDQFQAGVVQVVQAERVQVQGQDKGVEKVDNVISDHVIHTVKGLTNTIKNPTTIENRKATFVTFLEARNSDVISSRKPKPWHLVKKRGIIPDGLVQARLTHFKQLTNQGRGESVGVNSGFVLTNGKAGKRKAERLDSPGAKQQRTN